MSCIIIYICQNYLYINDDNHGMEVFIQQTHPGMRLLLTCPTTHDLFLLYRDERDLIRSFQQRPPSSLSSS